MTHTIRKKFMAVALIFVLLFSSTISVSAKVVDTKTIGSYAQGANGKLCWLWASYQSVAYQKGKKPTTSPGDVIRNSVAKGTVYANKWFFPDSCLVKIYNGDAPQRYVYKPTYGANALKTSQAINYLSKKNRINHMYKGVQKSVSWETLYKNRKNCPLLEFKWTDKNGKSDSHWVCVKNIQKKTNRLYVIQITDPTNGHTYKMNSTDFAYNYAKSLNKNISSAKWNGTVY